MAPPRASLITTILSTPVSEAGDFKLVFQYFASRNGNYMDAPVRLEDGSSAGSRRRGIGVLEDLVQERDDDLGQLVLFALEEVQRFWNYDLV